MITTEYEPELGWVLGHIEGTVSACCSWYARVVVLLFEYLLLCPSVHQFLFPWSEVLEQMDISFPKHSLLCTRHWQNYFSRQKLIHMNNLTANHTCASHDFSCANGKECIAMAWRCDRDYDCGDMSDEHDCEPGKVKSIHLPLGCCASCWEKLRFFLIFLSNNDFYISFFSCVMEALPLWPLRVTRI